MNRVRITVIERTLNPEIAEEYGSAEYKSSSADGRCPRFRDREALTLDGLEKPAGFCDRAWADIQGALRTVAHGGEHSFMVSRGAAIVCCTDGIRPVVFRIERVASEADAPTPKQESSCSHNGGRS